MASVSPLVLALSDFLINAVAGDLFSIFSAEDGGTDKGGAPAGYPPGAHSSRRHHVHLSAGQEN